jgi:hypothetical protein
MRAPTVLALLAVLPLLALAGPSGALGAMVLYTGVGEAVHTSPLGIGPFAAICTRMHAAATITSDPSTGHWRFSLVMATLQFDPEAGNEPESPLLPPDVCRDNHDFKVRGSPRAGFVGEGSNSNITVGRLGAATPVTIIGFQSGMSTPIAWTNATLDFRPFVV